MRRRINSSASADGRRVRRFFSRTSPVTPENPEARRSFLAKPPAPGAARRVLAVLNSQKRSSSRRIPPSVEPPFDSHHNEPAQNARRSLSSHRPPSTISHHQPSSPRQSESNWSGSNSPLKQTPVPSRPVRPLDASQSQTYRGRTDSGISSIPSSKGVTSLRHNQPVTFLDVEASEVSDDVNSSTDPKSRSGHFSASSTSVPPDTDPNQHGRQLNYQDESNNHAPSPNNLQHPTTERESSPGAFLHLQDRLRQLENEVDKLMLDREALQASNGDLELRNNELSVIVDSMRTRNSESTAEVAELTRHLKDTRKRLMRRIRDLEEQLQVKNARTGGDKQVSELVPTLAQQRFARVGSSPSISASRRQRAATPIAHASPHGDVGVRPLLSENTMPSQANQFSRVRSAGNVHDLSRRRLCRSESTGNTQRPATPNQKPSSSDSTTSARTLARRSLIRRAFIAHTHSQRYRDSRDAWVNFLQAETGTVTPEQFARAVRGLAVAADARGKDLDLLRKEVCGAEVGDTGVMTMTMFAEFYERTKDEPT